MILDHRLDSGDLIILDGATGSELRNFGATLDPIVWCGAANLHYPEAVRNVHEAYIKAGADIITTNTFATCRHVLDGADLGARTVEVNQRAVGLAMQARDRAGNGRDIAIAGSLSTMKAWLPGTITADPRYLPSGREALAANYHEQARTLCEAGVDLLVLEMMSDLESLMLAEAAQATGLPVWVGLSASTAPDGNVIAWHRAIEHPEESGDSAASPYVDFDELVGAYVDIAPQVMGVMHSTIASTYPALAQLRARWQGPTMAYPETIGTNASGKRKGTSCTPDDFARHGVQMVEEGVQIIGGCCGTTIAHLQALTHRLDRQVPV